MKRLFLALLFPIIAMGQFVATVPANTGPGIPQINPGWTFIQDQLMVECTATASSCTTPKCSVASVGCVYPTTSGSVWAIFVTDGASGATISSVTGGGGTWVIPSGGNACTNFQSGTGQPTQTSCAYNLGGTAGTGGNSANQITVNLASASTGFFALEFVEFLPPTGYTAAFDVAGATGVASCSTACSGVALTTTGTDAIVQFNASYGTLSQQDSFNNFSAPYTQNSFGDGHYLNAPSGSIAAPTVKIGTTAGTGQFGAIAFKTTSAFTTPSPVFSVVQYNNPNITTGNTCTGGSCSATTLNQTTGTGNLLFLVASNEDARFISTVSGGGTWVVPTACRVTNNTSNGQLSCAYVLSSTATSSITVTMSGTTVSGFSIWEISRNDAGSFALDGSIGATANASGTNFPLGIGITCTGTNDVIFQGIFGIGGPNPPTGYRQPIKNQFSPDNSEVSILLNTNSCTQPTYTLVGTTEATAVIGAAFK